MLHKLVCWRWLMTTFTWFSNKMLYPGLDYRLTTSTRTKTPSIYRSVSMGYMEAIHLFGAVVRDTTDAISYRSKLARQATQHRKIQRRWNISCCFLVSYIKLANLISLLSFNPFFHPNLNSTSLVRENTLGASKCVSTPQLCIITNVA